MPPSLDKDQLVVPTFVDIRCEGEYEVVESTKNGRRKSPPCLRPISPMTQVTSLREKSQRSRNPHPQNDNQVVNSHRYGEEECMPDFTNLEIEITHDSRHTSESKTKPSRRRQRRFSGDRSRHSKSSSRSTPQKRSSRDERNSRMNRQQESKLDTIVIDSGRQERRKSISHSHNAPAKDMYLPEDYYYTSRNHDNRESSPEAEKGQRHTKSTTRRRKTLDAGYCEPVEDCRKYQSEPRKSSNCSNNFHSAELRCTASEQGLRKNRRTTISGNSLHSEEPSNPEPAENHRRTRAVARRSTIGGHNLQNVEPSHAEPVEDRSRNRSTNRRSRIGGNSLHSAVSSHSEPLEHQRRNRSAARRSTICGNSSHSAEPSESGPIEDHRRNRSTARRSTIDGKSLHSADPSSFGNYAVDPSTRLPPITQQLKEARNRRKSAIGSCNESRFLAPSLQSRFGGASFTKDASFKVFEMAQVPIGIGLSCDEQYERRKVITSPTDARSTEKLVDEKKEVVKETEAQDNVNEAAENEKKVQATKGKATADKDKTAKDEKIKEETTEEEKTKEKKKGKKSKTECSAEMKHLLKVHGKHQQKSGGVFKKLISK